MINTENLKRDITPFTDPATDLKILSAKTGCLIHLVRNGSEHTYFLSTDGSIVARHANNRKFSSLRSLIASIDFADIRGFTSTQIRMSRDFDIESLILPEGSIDSKNLSLQAFQRSINPRSASATSQEAISILLLDGPAGVGKTSLIQRVLVQRARAQQDANAAPPILHVTSRGRRLTALDEALAQSIQVLRAKFTFDQVPTLIRHNLLQLAIDGFDELVDPEGYKDAWYALRDFFDATVFGGPIILAGRDTFFDEQKFSKHMEASAQKFILSHVRLGPISVSAAKEWLAKKGWNAKELADPYTALILRPGAYTLRPFFLNELSKVQSWKKINSYDVTPREYLVERFIERESLLISDQLSIDAHAAGDGLRNVFEEIATEMADNETDVVDLSFLQMASEFAFGEILSAADVAKLRHKAGSFALLDADVRDGFRRFPHTEISYHFLATSIIRLVNDGTPMRFLRRGIVSIDFLTIFGEVLLSLDLATARRFIRNLENLFSGEASFDRLPENVASLLLTSLCTYLEEGPRFYQDIQVSNVVLFGTVAPATLERVRIQRFDVQEAALNSVQFKDCEISNLHVDETTRFGTTAPTPHQIHLHSKDGSVVDLFDPTEIRTWLDDHSDLLVKEPNNVNEEAERLLDRVCRIMLRQHMIKDHESDDVGKFLRGRYWVEIEEILTKEKWIDRVDRKATAGSKAPFVRMRDPYKLLARKNEVGVAKVWSAVAAIPK